MKHVSAAFLAEFGELPPWVKGRNIYGYTEETPGPVRQVLRLLGVGRVAVRDREGDGWGEWRRVEE